MQPSGHEACCDLLRFCLQIAATFKLLNLENSDPETKIQFETK